MLLLKWNFIDDAIMKQNYKSNYHKFLRKIFFTFIVITILTILLSINNGTASQKSVRHITIYAKQWDYNPNVIEVNQGDKVVINLISLDVSHGIFIEGYEIRSDIIMAENKATNQTITFIADKAGTFIFRCSTTCGPFHPFMTGKLVVKPNTPFLGGISLSIIIGITVLAFYYIWRW